MKTPMQQYLELLEKAHYGHSYITDNGTVYVGAQDLSAEEAEALGKWLIDTCSAKYEVVLREQLRHIPREDVEKFTGRINIDEPFDSRNLITSGIAVAVNDSINFIDEKWGTIK